MAYETIENVVDFFKDFFEPNTSISQYKNQILPVWINHAARLYVVQLKNQLQEVVFVEPKNQLEFDQLRNLLNFLTTKANVIPILIADELNPKYRGLLVREHMNHVYNNVIFVPALGVANLSMSQFVVKNRVIREELSAASVKILAGLLLNKIPSEFKLKNLVDLLQFSSSKISGTLKELAAFDFISEKGSGPNKIFVTRSKEELWTRAQNVKTEKLYKLLSLQTNLKPDGYVLAGESALSMLTNLAEPKDKTVAVYSQDFEWGDTSDLIDWKSDLLIQKWKEDPRLFAKKKCINPIELFFSLKDNADERVQLELSELLEITIKD